jgi:cytoskeletal protein RodZ
MVDDEPVASMETVGQRLREAREAKGLTIEDVASATRIPTRHLQSLEDSEWHKLPASTYSVGFAKNYATAVGLDRGEIAEQLRAEMGSELPAHYSTAPVETFEPVDGNRAMPKGIVVGALVALVAIIALLTWLSNRELQSDDPAAEAPMDNVAAQAAPVPAVAAQGPVVITANEAAWIEVKDGSTVLKQGELAAGQSFEVPPSAAAPVLTTAKPEALRISVGTGDAPSVGPAGERVSNVSLLAADLMRGPGAAAPMAAAPTSQARARPTQRPASRTAPTKRESPPAPATTPPAAPENITNSL